MTLNLYIYRLEQQQQQQKNEIKNSIYIQVIIKVCFI